MRLPENDFQILKLTTKFYTDYPSTLYKGIMQNISRIKREALAFVEEYVAHKRGEKVLHPKEFERRYEYSPLQYFHRELDIDET